MDKLLLAIFTLSVAWSAGIVLWSNSLVHRYRSLRQARAAAAERDDWTSYVVINQAMRDIHADLCAWRLCVLSPWHWIKTARRDYTGRVLAELKLV